MANPTLLILAGDGIGPEVMGQVVRIIDWFGDKRDLAFDVDHDLVGGAAYDKHGTPLHDDTMAKAQEVDAVLLGAVGGPKWDHLKGADRPELGSLLPLRRNLNLYANIRPCKPYPALIDHAPLKRERLEGTDFVVMRELTGGIYFGKKGRDERGAFDECRYSEAEVKRIAIKAFDLAMTRKKKVTSVDKSNVLETSRLWRETVIKVAEGYPEVELEHLLVDAMTMHMLTKAQSFDVILTENMFGDILSDLGAGIIGSLGLAPSADIGDENAVFQPCHGTAPDIMGKGLANPMAMFMSAAMMLDWLALEHAAPGLARAGAVLTAAVDDAYADGMLVSTERGGTAGVVEITDAVNKAMDAISVHDPRLG